MEMTFKKEVISVQKSSFTDKATGAEKTMWKVFISDDDGAIGSLYSSQPVVKGDTVNIGIVVNRDGKIVAKIIQPKAEVPSVPTDADAPKVAGSKGKSGYVPN